MDERRRPSSAAFERWLETRPGVRSFLSAVSSARTLGTDDPEFSHLQLEMERRRSPMSEAALSRVRLVFYYILIPLRVDLSLTFCKLTSLTDYKKEMARRALQASVSPRIRVASRDGTHHLCVDLLVGRVFLYRNPAMHTEM